MILLYKLPQKVLEMILCPIINIHCIPLILNIIWKTLESYWHWVFSVLHDLRTTCQFLETWPGYRVQMGSSHVLIMFPSCSRDPARLQTGKNPKPLMLKHASALQALAHWVVQKSCWHQMLQQGPIMQILAMKLWVNIGTGQHIPFKVWKPNSNQLSHKIHSICMYIYTNDMQKLPFFTISV